MIILDKGAHHLCLLFDNRNPHWTGNPEYDRMFVMSIQRHENDIINEYGGVSLFDVLKDLGFHVPYEKVCDSYKWFAAGWQKSDKPIRIEYAPIDNKKEPTNTDNVSAVIFLM